MDENYRFFVNEATGEVYRARLVRNPYDGGDMWRNYWDSDHVVAFYDEGYRGVGVRPMDGAAPDDTERAISAYRYSGIDGLERVARRITNTDDARFIVVGLDRGCLDLYALSWSGDPDDEWHDEIEAVWNNEVYYDEVELYTPGLGIDGGDWSPADSSGEWWYGEDKAQAEFAEAYPLDAFPADLFTVGE